MKIVDLYNLLEKAMDSGRGERRVLWENDDVEGSLFCGAGSYDFQGNLVIFRSEEHE